MGFWVESTATMKAGTMTSTTDVRIFDLETADADQLYRGDHEGPFVRLAGAQRVGAPSPVIASGEAVAHAVHVLSDPGELLVGHNIIKFDIPALARHHGADIDALSRRAVDTLVLARLADPPGARGQKPWSTPGYYSLDAVAQRYGVASSRQAAKGTLEELAAEFGGYDRIPVGDPRYAGYLRDDLAETEAVYRALLSSWTPYAAREMRVTAVQARMTYNGWRVDVPVLRERVKAEQQRQAAAFERLHGEFGMPSRGSKNPLATNAAKDWFAAGLEHFGLPVPRTPVKRNGSGGNVSIGGDGLKVLRATPGLPPAAELVLDLMLVCAGVTAKYAEIDKHLIGDRVHPGIGADQASGRWAMTRPSTTNIGKRGPAKLAQREPFLPEPGHVLMTFDFDQVDMRGIAALSQDPAYAALFGPGMDAHAMIAELVLGSADHRESAKSIGHGWNYGEGPKKIAADKGIPLDMAVQFDQMMTTRFPVLCEWRAGVRALGQGGVLLDNGFGRLMRCDPARAYTQAPALMGQGSARDIMCEGLLRLDPQILPMLRAVVHDEAVLSVPVELVDEVRAHVLEAFTFTWRGIPITAGASHPGKNWGDCYRKAA